MSNNNNHKTKVKASIPVAFNDDEMLSPNPVLQEEFLKSTEIQELFESIYAVINIPVAIIDLNANVLYSSPGQGICSQFHRIHPTTCKRSVDSDAYLAAQIKEGKAFAISACVDFTSFVDTNQPFFSELRVGSVISKCTGRPVFCCITMARAVI